MTSQATRLRGLKLQELQDLLKSKPVASYTLAWIEISSVKSKLHGVRRKLYACVD